MFWKLNDSMKGKCDTFNRYKQTTKVCLVYLKVKLQKWS